MKIDSYQVNSQAKRSYTQISSMTTTITRSSIQPMKAQPLPETSQSPQDALNLSLDTKQEPSPFNWEKAVAKVPSLSPKDTLESMEELRRRMLERMMELIYGKKVKAFEPPKMPERQPLSFNAECFPQGQAFRLQYPQQNIAASQAITFTTESFFYESETVSYNANAIVNTADGRQINVDIYLNMSRQIAEYSQSELKIEQTWVDPLVVNFAGTAAQLSDTKFEFDLDFDGNMDSISFAGQGSGFLALDKNMDGVINDGSELFGPATGSGFGELRGYDMDNNGWIDENDDVFDKLSVWTKDEEGNDVYYKLKDLDIGAIYLGDMSTRFSVNNDSRQTQGQVQSTSFYLKEDGGAGLIQHIDLVT